MLFLEMTMIGVFTSLDLMLFYVFGNLHLFQCFILLDFGVQKKDFMQQLNTSYIHLQVH